jgi:hypothetical protein
MKEAASLRLPLQWFKDELNDVLASNCDVGACGCRGPEFRSIHGKLGRPRSVWSRLVFVYLCGICYGAERRGSGLGFLADLALPRSKQATAIFK